MLKNFFFWTILMIDYVLYPMNENKKLSLSIFIEKKKKNGYLFIDFQHKWKTWRKNWLKLLREMQCIVCSNWKIKKKQQQKEIGLFQSFEYLIQFSLLLKLRCHLQFYLICLFLWLEKLLRLNIIFVGWLAGWLAGWLIRNC